MFFLIRAVPLRRVLFAAVCLAALAGAAVLGVSSRRARPAGAGAFPEAGVAFLRGFGWRAEPVPEENGAFTVPERFGAVYGAYNALLREQGYDLRPYAGKTVRRCAYRVFDYPGWEGEPSVRAHLLVYDGRVIGGDLCSLRPDGFMEGLSCRYDDGTAG